MPAVQPVPGACHTKTVVPAAGASCKDKPVPTGRGPADDGDTEGLIDALALREGVNEAATLGEATELVVLVAVAVAVAVRVLVCVKLCVLVPV